RADRIGCQLPNSRGSTSLRTRSDLAVEGSADHIPLLLRSESDEVDRITGHTNGELRVLVRVLHRVFERLLVDDVQIHVESAVIEIDVESLCGGIDQFTIGQVRLLRRNGHGVTDAVLRILVGKLRNRQAGREPAVVVAAMHWVGTGPKWLPFAPSIGRIAGGFAVDNV